jgi:hypothetical protein
MVLTDGKTLCVRQKSGLCCAYSQHFPILSSGKVVVGKVGLKPIESRRVHARIGTRTNNKSRPLGARKTALGSLETLIVSRLCHRMRRVSYYFDFVTKSEQTRIDRRSARPEQWRIASELRHSDEVHLAFFPACARLSNLSTAYPRELRTRIRPQQGIYGAATPRPGTRTPIQRSKRQKMDELDTIRPPPLAPKKTSGGTPLLRAFGENGVAMI